MKRIIAVFVMLCMCLALCACANEEAQPTETPAEPTERPTEPVITEKEQQLVNYLIDIVTDSFYEPSAVRVLEIGDHVDNTMWRDEGQPESLHEFYGPETIVVRLQGENRIGGTLNHYYRICLTSAYNEDERELFAHEVLRYRGEAGQCAQLSDSYEITENASDEYDIGRINNALKEHWEELGF